MATELFVISTDEIPETHAIDKIATIDEKFVRDAGLDPALIPQSYGYGTLHRRTHDGWDGWVLYIGDASGRIMTHTREIQPGEPNRTLASLLTDHDVPNAVVLTKALNLMRIVAICRREQITLRVHHSDRALAH